MARRMTMKKMREGIALFKAQYNYEPMFIMIPQEGEFDEEWQILHPRMSQYCVFYEEDGQWRENKNFPNARADGTT